MAEQDRPMRSRRRGTPPAEEVKAARSEVQILVSGGQDDEPFALIVEPEAMQYEFPAQSKVLLTFKGPEPMQFDLGHHRDAIVIWRPGDTEVWATLTDGSTEQIGGFADNPAPWMDSGSGASGPAPWSWPPPRT
jgi:hypothetical protein